jgi:hypothetical protein
MSNKTNIIAHVSAVLIYQSKSALRLFIQALMETRRREAERSIAHWRTVLGEPDQTTNQPESGKQRDAAVSPVETSHIQPAVRSA